MKFLFFLFLFFTAVAYGDQTSPILLDAVVVVVGEQVITQSQIDDRLNEIKKMTPPEMKLPPDSELKKQILEEQIDKLVQLQVAKNVQIQVTDEELASVIKDIATRNHVSLKELKEKLMEEGMTYDHYSQEIRDGLILHKLQQQELVPTIQISKQEIHDYLQHAPEKKLQASRYHLVDYFIALPENPSTQAIQQAQALSQSTREVLRAGRAVDENSVKTIDLALRKKEELPTLFQPLVDQLTVGEIREVRAENGFHNIRLIEIESMKPQSIEETHVKRILVKENALNNAEHIKYRLLQIRSRIAEGGDFSSFAKTVSQEPQGSVEGGDVGWVRPGMMEPEVESILSTLKIGEVSQPIKTTQGWLLVQVVGRRAIQDKQVLREAEAREVLFKQKIDDKLKAWIQKLRQEFYIHYEK